MDGDYDFYKRLDIEMVMPRGFQHDPSMSRAGGVKCPVCSSDKGIVVAYAFSHRMTPCFGCKHCAFRWWQTQTKSS